MAAQAAEEAAHVALEIAYHPVICSLTEVLGLFQHLEPEAGSAEGV